MSKKGNYIGGSTVINTMTAKRAKFLDERMYDHLRNKELKTIFADHVVGEHKLIKKEESTNEVQKLYLTKKFGLHEKTIGNQGLQNVLYFFNVCLNLVDKPPLPRGRFYSIDNKDFVDSVLAVEEYFGITESDYHRVMKRKIKDRFIADRFTVVVRLLKTRIIMEKELNG